MPPWLNSPANLIHKTPNTTSHRSLNQAESNNHNYRNRCGCTLDWRWERGTPHRCYDRAAGCPAYRGQLWETQPSDRSCHAPFRQHSCFLTHPLCYWLLQPGCQTTPTAPLKQLQSLIVPQVRKNVCVACAFLRVLSCKKSVCGA